MIDDMITKVAAIATAAILTVSASPGAIDYLKGAEGLRNTAYADPAYGWGMPTICYGQTEGVKRGDYLTDAQCNDWLLRDVEKHCAVVYYDLKDTGVTLTQGEQDAYCLFAYNTGYFKFNGSNNTAMYRELMRGNHRRACEGLLLYTYANGKELRGLVNRRKAEYEMCISQLPEGA